MRQYVKFNCDAEAQLQETLRATARLKKWSRVGLK